MALGHDATSCDILPTDVPGKHYQGDIRDILYEGWDLMVAHPPCTYLTNSGVRWLHDTRPQFANRWNELQDGAEFFKLLLDAPIPMRAIENPKMHKYAVDIIGRRQDQVIQPYEFGHTESKGTGLWLEGLPLLTGTHDVKAEMLALPKRESHKVHYASPGKDRWKERSTTYQGIAIAMATQWSAYAESLTELRSAA
jgi:hypothetical protein